MAYDDGKCIFCGGEIFMGGYYQMVDGKEKAFHQAICRGCGARGPIRATKKAAFNALTKIPKERAKNE